MIPEIELHPLINVPETNYEDGALPADQAGHLLTMLIQESPEVVLEIGTFFGHTTKLMAEALPKVTIHTVDLPPDYLDYEDPLKGKKDDFHLIGRRVVGREFQGTREARKIVQHFVDTAVWDFNEAAGATFFFIDGSHTYEYAKNDSEKCWELCGGKGLFVWHDCDDGHPGVVRLLEEWCEMGRNVSRIAGTPLAFLDTLR